MDIPYALLDDFYQAIQETPLQKLQDTIPSALEQRFRQYRHGLLDQWLKVYHQLPDFVLKEIDLQRSVRVEPKIPLDIAQREQLIKQLKEFHPWRKGPYYLHGIHIDTEWHSDWKWDRIASKIAPLADRYVLDVGCGNGYHCWRMLGAGSKMVIGIDPSQLFWIQFHVIKHFLGSHPAYFLPLGIEYLPEDLQCFDTVFSMGVLYHRKSPFEHLQQLRSLLRDGGELVLETLVIEGNEQAVLVPEDRYACMANVWFIPSTLALEKWLYKAGFKNIALIDCTATSLSEQRTTDWMQFQSLADFLKPEDYRQTIEGYPAPLRATFIAIK